MNNALRGAAWMILAGFCWTIMTILARQLSADYSAFEILFFRFFLEKSSFPMKRIAETDSPGPGVSVPLLESW